MKKLRLYVSWRMFHHAVSRYNLRAERTLGLTWMGITFSRARGRGYRGEVWAPLAVSMDFAAMQKAMASGGMCS